MLTFFNILLDGVTYGMILFMIAVGLSVTMGLMRIINLAHGGFALIAGASLHWLTVMKGMSFWPAVCAALICLQSLVAVLLEQVLYRGIYSDGRAATGAGDHRHCVPDDCRVDYLLGSTILSIPLPDAMRGSVDLGVRTLPTIVCS